MPKFQDLLQTFPLISKKLKDRKKRVVQSVRPDLTASRRVMDLGSLRLIRYFVEFDSGHISIPQGLAAYSLISEPLNPIRSSPKPAAEALPVAVMLKL